MVSVLLDPAWHHLTNLHYTQGWRLNELFHYHFLSLPFCFSFTPTIPKQKYMFMCVGTEICPSVHFSKKESLQRIFLSGQSFIIKIALPSCSAPSRNSTQTVWRKANLAHPASSPPCPPPPPGLQNSWDFKAGAAKVLETRSAGHVNPGWCLGIKCGTVGKSWGGQQHGNQQSLLGNWQWLKKSRAGGLDWWNFSADWPLRNTELDDFFLYEVAPGQTSCFAIYWTGTNSFAVARSTFIYFCICAALYQFDAYIVVEGYLGSLSQQL